MINNDLYTGASDGSLNRRTFDGHTFGTPSAVDGADALVNETDWHNQVKTIKGMFYANGRLYYTRGTSSLYYRGFNPESGVVAALEVTASGNLPGVDWSTVGGMFTAGGKLYYVSTSDGKLRSLDFTGGVPSGTPAVVDNGDWRGQGVFLYAGVPNNPPAAAFTADCDAPRLLLRRLRLDGHGRHRSRPTPGTSATVRRARAPRRSTRTPRRGTYTVKLTVTDDRGGTGTRPSRCTRTNAANIDYVGTDVYNANTTNATVTVPRRCRPATGCC